MMFLLRLAFWILLICLLLPGQPQENHRLLASAQKTVTDVESFCVRNPDVCEDARVSMTAMLAKLKSGADLLQSWLSQGAAKGPEPGRMYPRQFMPADSLAGQGSDQPARAVPSWSNSLSQSDREPPWRGPSEY